jgi:signal-induced proliferation-associated 1 like protein 2
MDPEMLGLTYIKGASTDSGIDTNPCMPPGARHLLQVRGGEQAHPWPSELAEDAASEDDHGKMYLPQGYAAAIMEGSLGDLSEISSHSRCGRPVESAARSASGPQVCFGIYIQGV